jgi:hypothetical protein
MLRKQLPNAVSPWRLLIFLDADGAAYLAVVELFGGHAWPKRLQWQSTSQKSFQRDR